ncbi:hypothetical protein JCM10908_006773 [Rhodotorula pacifica]|uniref:uncharacterized protein n=1 Tax=Rhodotorula pacifica TaxID=1495444 RepID=UPI00316E9CC0
MTAFRLPLELELHILKLAAPRLAMDSLADRVKFLIKVSLVHRSFTAWAQDKLAEQFVYTYSLEANDFDRLQKRRLASTPHTIRWILLDLRRAAPEWELCREIWDEPDTYFEIDNPAWIWHRFEYLRFASRHDHLTRLVLIECDFEHCLRATFWILPNLRDLILFDCKLLGFDSNDGWDDNQPFEVSIERIHVVHVGTSLWRLPGDTIMLPSLQSFTLTWAELPIDEDALPSDSTVPEEWATMRRKAVETFIAPNCTFDFKVTTRKSAEALADAIVELNL